MKFFKPEDFPTNKIAVSNHPDHGDTLHLTPYDAAYLANAKLEREGKVVYGAPHGSSQEFEEPWIACDINRYPGMTRKALLINIEPVEGI